MYARTYINPEFQRLLQEASPPEWVIEMQRHFAETRSYRLDDYLRLVGDPLKCVRMERSMELQATTSPGNGSL